VTLVAGGELSALLARHADDLPTIFGVSQVDLQTGPAVTGGPEKGQETTAKALHVVIDKAAGVKCARCWRYVPSVNGTPEWLGICDRCVTALTETVSQ